MLDYQSALLTAAGASTLVMRVGGDSQELIPQIHQGSRTTQRQACSAACLALFRLRLLWNETSGTQTMPRREHDTEGFVKIQLGCIAKSVKILQGDVIRDQWLREEPPAALVSCGQ